MNEKEIKSFVLKMGLFNAYLLVWLLIILFYYELKLNLIIINMTLFTLISFTHILYIYFYKIKKQSKIDVEQEEAELNWFIINYSAFFIFMI
ncbi:hypothetical protein [Mycoplasma sp. P36-A1]|uniref:hypothetical protein n=1 Tax=Mycoplasma sp. P36-A1 TaxID=3252900 RepID=UPI003C2DBB13